MVKIFTMVKDEADIVEEWVATCNEKLDKS